MSKVYKEQMKHMATTNESMVELCQQLIATNQEQWNYIAKLITQIEALAQLLASN